MSWGYDLVMDADKSAWMRWVTRYTLKRSAFFTSDANVSRDKAIAFGANPDRTVILPWGTDIEHFQPKKPKRSNAKSFTLFCSRTWESIYGVDVLAKAFVRVAAQNPKVALILLGGGSQGPLIRQLLINGGVLDHVHFGGQVGQRDGLAAVARGQRARVVERAVGHHQPADASEVSPTQVSPLPLVSPPTQSSR